MIALKQPPRPSELECRYATGRPDVLQRARSLADWFAMGLVAAPNGIALRIGMAAWTYAELHALALKLGGAICAACDGRPSAVGVLAARSIECYAGILAASYSGAAVVPMSPGFPVERSLQMARVAGIQALIVDRQGASILSQLAQADGMWNMPAIRMDEELAVPAGTRRLDVAEAVGLSAPVCVGPDDIAYVLFTSGTTGRPKGVPVTHANMMHFLSYNSQRYALTVTDVCSQTFDCTFDLAMFDLFMTWTAGAELVSTPPHAFLSLPAFAARHGMTVWFSVPNAISLIRRRGGLYPRSLSGLRLSLFCGEPLTMADAQQWQDAAPLCRLENLYGPTELTIACSAYRWDPHSSPNECLNGLVPIGHLYPTMRGVLLDESGQVGGQKGELCVSGPQQFPGYLNPADDRLRFHVHDGQRWYRTGDLMQATAAGYAYLGRVDHQIKIRGYRVELAELEWHARSVPGVDKAVVVPVSDGASRRLFGWYTGEPRLAQLISKQLERELPEFMVPHWVRRLDKFPLNANGKVDRGELTAIAQRIVDDLVSGAEVQAQ